MTSVGGVMSRGLLLVVSAGPPGVSIIKLFYEIPRGRLACVALLMTMSDNTEHCAGFSPVNLKRLRRGLIVL